MQVKIFLVVVAAYISFEVIEHLLVPLIGRIYWKGKRQVTELFVMPKYHSVFHNKHDLLKHRDILQGITGHGHDIG